MSTGYGHSSTQLSQHDKGSHASPTSTTSQSPQASSTKSATHADATPAEPHELIADRPPQREEEVTSSTPPVRREGESAAKVKRPRGFAAMDRKLVSEIARKGGKAAHSAGTAHEFTTDEARLAGRKGGRATHAKRRELGESASESTTPPSNEPSGDSGERH